MVSEIRINLGIERRIDIKLEENLYLRYNPVPFFSDSVAYHVTSC